MPMTATYLDTLNSEQRRAVEHGLSQQDCTGADPLLVIAGAGSGKTNTLAHRVAHLIVNGADPRRILLMTFSRRAAAEMTRRVERIARQVIGNRAGTMTDALTWAGTFPGIGAPRPQPVSVGYETGQACYIAESVLENREGGSTLKQQAVLFRTSHHCGPLEVELTRRNIPFVKYGGLKFLDAAHIRDILALLRFVENPRDGIAGFRVMQLIPGIGPASARGMLDHMMGAADPIRALLDVPSPPRAADDWQAFVDTISSLRAGRTGWPAEFERARRWYESHLERLHEDSVTRRADLIQLEQIASGYPSRERFLTELTLDPPDA